MFGASVRDSEFQRTHILFSVNLIFVMHLCYGASAEIWWLTEDYILSLCLGFWISADAYTINCLANLSFIMHLF